MLRVTVHLPNGMAQDVFVPADTDDMAELLHRAAEALHDAANRINNN